MIGAFLEEMLFWTEPELFGIEAALAGRLKLQRLSGKENRESAIGSASTCRRCPVGSEPKALWTARSLLPLSPMQPCCKARIGRKPSGYPRPTPAAGCHAPTAAAGLHAVHGAFGSGARSPIAFLVPDSLWSFSLPLRLDPDARHEFRPKHSLIPCHSAKARATLLAPLP